MLIMMKDGIIIQEVAYQAITPTENIWERKSACMMHDARDFGALDER